VELSDRKKRILKAIVETFVQTAEPVGSKTIAADTKLGLSSATIRNEMAELTSLGYLEQPHTSAGRVPSPQGYRMYVNELMNEHKLSLQETQEINKALKQKMSSLTSCWPMRVSLFQILPIILPTHWLHRSQYSHKRFDCIYVDRNTVIAVAMLDNIQLEQAYELPEGVDEAFVKSWARFSMLILPGLRAVI
jgi:heat-inducible transcriptional repressor